MQKRGEEEKNPIFVEEREEYEADLEKLGLNGIGSAFGVRVLGLRRQRCGQLPTSTWSKACVFSLLLVCFCTRQSEPSNVCLFNCHCLIIIICPNVSFDQEIIAVYELKLMFLLVLQLSWDCMIWGGF